MNKYQVGQIYIDLARLRDPPTYAKVIEVYQDGSARIEWLHNKETFNVSVDDKQLILEEIYESPLYKLMKE